MIPQQPDTKRGFRCVRCGYNLGGIRVGDNCPECGEVVSVRNLPPYPTHGAAVASLVLGIISIIGCSAYGVLALICGPLAIYFAGKARRAIEAGQADPDSMGMATAGRICGIIGTCLGGIVILIVLGFIALAIAGVVAGAP